MTYPNPVTITIRRPGGTDRNGDPLPTTTHTVEGCMWWPRTSSESNTSGNAVIVGLTLTGPVDADINSGDQVLFPDDDTPWYVEGEAGRRVSPFGSHQLDHFEVALTRQRG